MSSKVLYSDKLVEIYDDSIILLKYYFPSMALKKIFFKDIEIIEVRNPTFFSGKWRIQGTGNFRTWYPFDSSRPKRDKIFILKLKNKWNQAGFTVENSYTVEAILKAKRLIR
jgi:hypothetical protein